MVYLYQTIWLLRLPTIHVQAQADKDIYYRQARKDKQIVSESKNFQNLNLSNVIAPDREIGSSAPEKKPEQKKSRRGLAIGGIGLTGLLLAGGIAFGVNTLNAAPKSEPTAEAPAEPGPTPTAEVPVVENPTDGEPTTPEEGSSASSMEVSSDLLNNPDTEAIPTAIAGTFLDKVEAWLNAGATPGNYQDSLNKGELGEAAAARIASDADPLYTAALFGSDWKNSNESMQRYIDRLKQIHYETVLLYLTTTPTEYNLEDKEAFQRYTNLKSAQLISQKDDKVILLVEDFDSDNSSMNRVGNSDFAPAVDSSDIAHVSMTWEKQGDKLVLVDMGPA